jgi:hypothetical protein
MKNLFTILLVCLFSYSATAQVTWFNPEDQWTFHITTGWVGEGVEQIKLEKDSVINNISYKKLALVAQYNSGGLDRSFRMVRQDGKKIFAQPVSSSPVTSEFLLYDFGLQVGDVVSVPIWDSPTTIQYTITEVSTVDIGGQARVQQKVKWAPGTSANKSTFIEGIGCVLSTHLIGGVDCLSSSYFFLDTPSQIAFDGPERTFCSFQSGAITYEGLGNTKCKPSTTQWPSEQQVDIFPNPSTGTLFFSAAEPQANYQVMVYDLLGRQILQTSLNGSGTIVTDFKGAAFVAVQTENWKMVRRVIFKE